MRKIDEEIEEKEEEYEFEKKIDYCENTEDVDGRNQLQQTLDERIAGMSSKIEKLAEMMRGMDQY